MCQTDWDANKVKFLRRKNLTLRRSAIATILGFQVSTLSILPSPILPSPVFAETQASPLAEDTPEEVLRAEIYTDARSPIDGKQLSAAEYTELIEKLRSLDHIPPEDLVSPKVREVIGLLKLRKFLKQFIPFVP
jgi:hypothetical protein